jgi:hypothetical protein
VRGRRSTIDHMFLQQCLPYNMPCLIGKWHPCLCLMLIEAMRTCVFYFAHLKWIFNSGHRDPLFRIIFIAPVILYISSFILVIGIFYSNLIYHTPNHHDGGTHTTLKPNVHPLLPLLWKGNEILLYRKASSTPTQERKIVCGDIEGSFTVDNMSMFALSVS